MEPDADDVNRVPRLKVDRYRQLPGDKDGALPNWSRIAQATESVTQVDQQLEPAVRYHWLRLVLIAPAGEEPDAVDQLIVGRARRYLVVVHSRSFSQCGTLSPLLGQRLRPGRPAEQPEGDQQHKEDDQQLDHQGHESDGQPQQRKHDESHDLPGQNGGNAGRGDREQWFEHDRLLRGRGRESTECARLTPLASKTFHFDACQLTHHPRVDQD